MSTLQQTVFALLSMLQQHRLMAGRDGMGREAWSEVEASDRRTARQIRVADPDVRLMRPEEARAFDAAAAHPGGVGVRRVTAPGDGVDVGVAPLGPNGAWGLRAQASATTSATASTTGGATSTGGVTVSVRCVDEVTAQRLAHDIVRRGPEGVGTLERYAREATRRAVQAAAELAEPESRRLQRAAAVVRQTWSDRPGLAERVITPSPAHAAARARVYNPAFGALAYRLAQLEERGFPMGDVLSRLDVDALCDPGIRNPAAFAEYLVQGWAARLPVINLGPEESVSAAAVGPDGPADDAAPVSAPAAAQPTAQPTAPPTAQERAAATVLQHALPEEVWQRVRNARGFARLRVELGRRIERGHDVAALLQHLPTEHIVRAHDPAGYLRAVIQRAGRGTAPPDGTAPPRGSRERTAVAGLVLRGLGADLGAEVLACRAWPGLAARLAQWQTRGLPLDELIADLPAARLATARFPAAYASSVLAATIAARQEDPGSTERPGNGLTRERHSSPPPGTRPATTRRDTYHGDGPAEGAPAKQRASPRDPTDLDPASAVDRVGFAARLGTGTIADDAAREALLDRAAAPRNGGGDQPTAAAATAEAVHRTAAAAAAGPARNAPAAPATGARNDPDGPATGGPSRSPAFMASRRTVGDGSAT
jgi:DNA-binding protein YbaB